MSRQISFFNESLKLDTNIELIYLENAESSPDTMGITQLAKIHKSLIINKKKFYEISLLTDTNGDVLDSSAKILANNVVSFKIHKTIKNRKLYYLEDEIIGTIFADNTLENKNPLESTSRSALGSGIYGVNLPTLFEAKKLSVDNRNIYEIDLDKAFDIQDKEHGESITTASLLTNRFLDRIISNININDLDDMLELKDFIKNDNIENLVILWNIVFYRNKRYLSYDKLENILCDYLIEFFTNHELIDKNNNKSLIALPINYIMKEMGYIGLIADDIYNNGWNRGCVSYIFDKSDPLIQGNSFY